MRCSHWWWVTWSSDPEATAAVAAASLPFGLMVVWVRVGFALGLGVFGFVCLFWLGPFTCYFGWLLVILGEVLGGIFRRCALDPLIFVYSCSRIINFFCRSKKKKKNSFIKLEKNLKRLSLLSLVSFYLDIFQH